jgi:hypothetical protein
MSQPSGSSRSSASPTVVLPLRQPGQTMRGQTVSGPAEAHHRGFSSVPLRAPQARAGAAREPDHRVPRHRRRSRTPGPDGSTPLQHDQVRGPGMCSAHVHADAPCGRTCQRFSAGRGTSLPKWHNRGGLLAQDGGKFYLRSAIADLISPSAPSPLSVVTAYRKPARKPAAGLRRQARRPGDPARLDRHRRRLARCRGRFPRHTVTARPSPREHPPGPSTSEAGHSSRTSPAGRPAKRTSRRHRRTHSRTTHAQTTDQATAGGHPPRRRERLNRPRQDGLPVSNRKLTTRPSPPDRRRQAVTADRHLITRPPAPSPIAWSIGQPRTTEAGHPPRRAPG